MAVVSKGTGVQSLERALEIISMLKEEGGMDASELAKRIGLHRSSIYRIIAVLLSKGYVRHELESSKYYIGLVFLDLAEAIDFQRELVLIALPFMEELKQKTRETSHLMVLDKGEVVYLAKLESPETIRTYSRVGIRMPAYCTAGGKVLLASLSWVKQKNILEQIELKKLTENTITNKTVLLDHLSKISIQGWAIDDEENEMGICCVAAPIKRINGKTVAAVTISCPTFRTTTQMLEQYINDVKETAEKISNVLQ